MQKTFLWIPVVLVFFVPSAFGNPAGVLEKDGGVSFVIDGREWMNFRCTPIEKSKFKPYLDVLTTPEGRNILRDGPDDHLHHHGLMFAVQVDGVNFWEENEPTAGRQVVRSRSAQTVERVEKDEGTESRTVTAASLTLALDWLDRDDNALLRENRKIELCPDTVTEATLVDWTSTLSIPKGRKKAEICGSHYNGLGMRFDKSMDSGGRFFADADQKIEGQTECRWMAYTAPLDGKMVTVAVFDAPDNFRKMTAFTMGGDGKGFSYLAAALNLHREPFELKEGQTARFRYGVCLWEGERRREEIETAHEIWVKRH